MKRACLIALGLWVSMSAAQDRAKGRATASPTARPRTPTTLAMLNQRVDEVSFQDVPLEQVMDWLGDYTGANVQVRWSVLESNGIDKDKRITMKVKNLRLSQILWLLMNEAGGTDVKLAYRASGNLILLSTHDDLGKDMIVKVYDVSDLLVRVPRFTNAANLNPTQALTQAGQSGQGGGGGGSNIFEDEGNDDQGRDRGEDTAGGQSNDMQQLIRVIKDTVEPNDWVDAGGQAQITALRNQIVVRASILVHQQLGGYVDESDIP